MSLLNLEETYGRRLPFTLFVFGAVALLEVSVCLFRSDPLYIGRMLFFMVVVEWSSAVKARANAAGILQGTWMRLAYGTSVMVLCIALFIIAPFGRFFTPFLFGMLNLPLALSKSETRGRTGAPVGNPHL